MASIGKLDYVDPGFYSKEERTLTTVSGLVAAKAFNDLCRMIGGHFPDAKMQKEAPLAYEFFTKLMGQN